MLPAASAQPRSRGRVRSSKPRTPAKPTGVGKGPVGPQAPSATNPVRRVGPVVAQPGVAFGSPAGGGVGSPIPPADPFQVQAGDDAATQGTVAAVTGSYQRGLAGLAHQETATRQGLGFAQAAPGTPGAIQDPATGRWFRLDIENNPYSMAAKLKHDFDLRRKGITNSAREHIYDGATQALEQHTERERVGANYELGNLFLNKLLGYGADRQSLFDEAVTSLTGARSSQADRDATQIAPNQGDDETRGRGAAEQAKPKAKPKKRGKRGKGRR